MPRRFSNVIGIDDAPFARSFRGDVTVVGAIFAAQRLDGVLTTTVRRDGANATDRIASMILGSRFPPSLHAILLQGIALAGFNVVDIHGLAERTGLPVLVVARHAPDMTAIRRVLTTRVAGGSGKWRLVERAGPMVPLGPVWVQTSGLSLARAREVLERFTVHGHLPEPIRAAHLIAGAIATGTSRGRA